MAKAITLSKVADFFRSRRRSRVSTINKERRLILIAVFALTLFGILMVYEASSVYAYNTATDAMYFFKRQIMFFLVAFVAFVLALAVDLDWLRQYNKEFLIGTVVLLILVLLVGKKIGGARRWFDLGPFNFQPSEILKIIRFTHLSTSWDWPLVWPAVF